MQSVLAIGLFVFRSIASWEESESYVDGDGKLTAEASTTHSNTIIGGQMNLNELKNSALKSLCKRIYVQFEANK